MRELTEKQKRFVQEYLIDGNAARAARDAGYSEHTARTVGQENLTKPDIVAALNVERAKRQKTYQVDEAFVINGLAEIASMAPEEFPDTMRMSDKRQALVDIGKHIGMFVERRMDMTGQEVLDRLEKGRQRVEQTRLEVVGGKDVA